MTPSPRRAVLFDVDGTLIDSSYLHALAWWQAFRREGHDIPMSALHRCVGMGGDKLVQHFLPECDDATQESLLTTHGAVFSTFWPSLRAFDGARDLLAACSQAGLAVGLASSAQQRDLDASMEVLAARDVIDAWTSSGDAEASKPDPDILVACLEKLKIDAADAVFVGDAVWDVQAAAALGIQAIALTCGGISAGELRDAGAAEIYDSPRQLLDHLSDSIIGALLTSEPSLPA